VLVSTSFGRARRTSARLLADPCAVDGLGLHSGVAAGGQGANTLSRIVSLKLHEDCPPQLHLTAMTPKEWALTLSGLLLCGLAAFGAAHLSLGLGIGPNMTTALSIGVVIWANVVLEARHARQPICESDGSRD
jgi:hypothetical protein